MGILTNTVSSQEIGPNKNSNFGESMSICRFMKCESACRRVKQGEVNKEFAANNFGPESNTSPGSAPLWSPAGNSPGKSKV